MASQEEKREAFVDDVNLSEDIENNAEKMLPRQFSNEGKSEKSSRPTSGRSSTLRRRSTLLNEIPGSKNGRSKKQLKRSDSTLSVVSKTSLSSSGRHSSFPSSRHDVSKAKKPGSETKRKKSAARRIHRKWKLLTNKAASLVGSVASVDSRRPKSFPVWPEFTENDINSEKWDSSAKGKEKGKSPSLQSFEDPEGRIELPASLKVHEWKRPIDFLEGKTPIVVDENEGDFDLLRPNEHLCHSELIRWIISQITALWNISLNKKESKTSLTTRNSATPEPGEESSWRPWEHIYSMTKVAKGPNIPQYNQYGKYVVKLYWMGCWRKIVVDDYLPFDADGRMLLPALDEDYKLWPMILSKALIKVAAIDYRNTEAGSEFGDYFVIHCLTGWLPETIPLKYGHLQKIWDLLKDILPEWQRPEEKPKELPSSSEGESGLASVPSKKDRLESGAVKQEQVVGSAQKGSKEGKGKDAGKKKDDKKSGAEQESSSMIEKHPETVVFAMFSHPNESPARVTVLKEMADASEKLRKIGLSHLHPHPVLLTKIRDKPLIPPLPPPVIPRWKLIRPKKKRMTPSDEPIPEPEPPKPDQWLEITSPFVNHKINPLPLDPNFIKSRTSPVGVKGSRPSTGATLKGIDEDTENRNEMPKDDGVFRAQHISSRGKVSGRKDTGSRLKERRESGRGSPSTQSHVSSVKDVETDGESMQSQGIDGSKRSEKDDAGNIDVVVDSTEIKITDDESSETSNKNVWVDFEDFCKSFQTLVIFHKPGTYTCNKTVTEIKHSLISGIPTSGGGGGGGGSKKGSANLNQANSSSNLKALGKGEEERIPSFLFVDNVEKTELIVSFSVLPKWSGMESEREKKISDKESVTGGSEVASVKEAGSSLPSTGLLVAEPYTWKSLVTGQSILRLKTTGVRAACLTLPEGRHVLRLFFDTPLGYSLSVCSTVNFVFGDEETVMKPLLEESCRFIQTANNIVQSIGKCIETMGDVEKWHAARHELQQAHMPYVAGSKEQQQHHFKIWHRAFYDSVSQLMSDNKAASLVFALQSFTFDCSLQPVTTLEPKEPSEVHEQWVNREATNEEMKAIVCIQRNWRKTYKRKIRRVLMKRESKEHMTVKEILITAWQLIQTNLENFGFKILRTMFKDDPAMITNFPFHKDEWNKISYSDYSGTYDEQFPNTWFVVFREIFYVEEDMLCVPKLYTTLRTCALRVVDNDTGEEIMRVFQKVAPHVYKRNKRGYTFVGEARSLDYPLPAGKWRLRLIGSSNPLPQPITGQVNYHFKIKDNNGFYIPNKKNIILRYHVKVKSDTIATIQFQSSKPDVSVKLQVLDNEKEVVSSKGIGHCVIPAFYFLSDEKSRPSSRSSHQESRHVIAQPSKQAVGGLGKKRTGSAKSKDGKASPKQSRKNSVDVTRPREDSLKQIVEDETSSEVSVPHKYTIQALVERDSWPLSESQWNFVYKLMEQEKEELKVYSAKGDRPGSPSASKVALGKSSAVPDKGKKAGKGGEKGGKEKKMHDKESGSRPQSQYVFDYSKPSWLLNVVLDDDKADDVEVKKDTDRQEEIKAEKRAWEAAEQGRAIKALQSRNKYLEEHAKKTETASEKETEEEGQKSEELSEAEPTEGKDEILTLEPPRPPTPKIILDPIDLSPFYRPSPDQVSEIRYLDDKIRYEKERGREMEIKKYEEEREEILNWRERERSERMLIKINQLKKFQEMQWALDDVRAELRKPREAYRQSLLEEERKRREEEEERSAALLAAAEASSGSASPKGKKSAGKKKK